MSANRDTSQEEVVLEYVAVSERLAAQAQRRALAILRNGMEPAARKLLRIIGSPFADQVTVAAIRALFDVTNARRFEVTGASKQDGSGKVCISYDESKRTDF